MMHALAPGHVAMGADDFSDLLIHAHHRVQGKSRLLKYDGYPGTTNSLEDLRRCSKNIDSVEQDRAVYNDGTGRQDAENGSRECRLSTTGWTE